MKKFPFFSEIWKWSYIYYTSFRNMNATLLLFYFLGIYVCTKKYLISDIIVLSFVFICCWYRFLSYTEVLFWLHNVKFEFPKFSFSWFHKPIKDCLFLRLKTEMCWAIKDKWIKEMTCYLFKVWLFWKQFYYF